MKIKTKFFLYKTPILAIWLLASCGNKGANQGSSLLKAYAHAKDAQDYQTAATLLTQLASEDSVKYTWAFDSLAFYHYFYLYTPGVVRNPNTTLYYAQRGIDINPSNNFLIEIKARMDLESQKVNVAESSFQSLWQKTGDDTYWWILSFIQAHTREKYATADSMINVAIANPEADKKTVRIDHIPERLQEKVASKAAFLYLKATILMRQNKVMEASQVLGEAVKIAPNFYAAKRSIFDMQQGARQGQQMPQQ